MKLFRKYDIDITNGPMQSGILLFTLPVILTNILQTLYNAADMIIVGRYAGDICLAAVGATSSITNLIVGLFIGMGAGVSAIVSRYIGAEDFEKTSKAVHTSVAISLLFGIIIALFGIFASRTLLTWMGTPDNVIDYSVVYMQIIFAGVPANLLYNFSAAVLRSMGDTKRPLYFLTAAGLINVVLNLFFVIVFKMNVAGVALATIISQYISAALVVITLIRTDNACRLIPGKIRVHMQELKHIILIGLPAGIQSCTYSISNILIQSSVNSFGAHAMSGFTAGANILNFVSVTMDSFATAAIVYSAQNYGARKIDRVVKSTMVCYANVIVIGTVLGFISAQFATQLIGIYAPGNAEVAMYGLKYLIMFKYISAFGGINGVATAAMRGLGKSILPMIVSIAGICGFRIIWILTLFPHYPSLETLYISYPITWVLTALVNTIMLFAMIRKIKKQEPAD
ncbi:MAG: MATE family efflux transporter [Clostridia bacterium]|nr:MATE family efflux transporter [Clostridia bacterium]